MSNTIDAILSRRSIRKYKPDMVPKKIIEKIVQAGTYAATGLGKQSPIILAVTNKELRDKLSKMNAEVMGTASDPFYGAPVVLVVLADKSRPTYVYDGSLVIGNLMLAAHELGIASCWIHRAKEEFESPEGKEILRSLGIEGDYEGIGHCILGYADMEAPKAAPRKENYVYFVEYAHTRHNVGFDAIDVLAEKYNIKVENAKGRALTGSGRIEGQSVLLVKPLTFMNLSGESIRALTDFYKIDETSQLIVIYDDISLPPGQLRIREKGSAGGHNGIKSIISHLGGQEFLRIKVGVGEKPAGWDLADYVLSRFAEDDRKKVEEALERAADAAVCLMTDGVEAAMNEYNRKVSE